MTCTCASFFTVRGVHKRDCPARIAETFDRTLIHHKPHLLEPASTICQICGSKALDHAWKCEKHDAVVVGDRCLMCK